MCLPSFLYPLIDSLPQDETADSMDREMMDTSSSRQTPDEAPLVHDYFTCFYCLVLFFTEPIFKIYMENLRERK